MRPWRRFPKPLLFVKIGETLRHSDATHGWAIMFIDLIFRHNAWNCCPKRYGKFRVAVCFSFGDISWFRVGGESFRPPPNVRRCKTLNILRATMRSRWFCGSEQETNMYNLLIINWRFGCFFIQFASTQNGKVRDKRTLLIERRNRTI